MAGGFEGSDARPGSLAWGARASQHQTEQPHFGRHALFLQPHASPQRQLGLHAQASLVSFSVVVFGA